MVYPNGRKYFTGRIKKEEFWVGTYGSQGGELTLGDAREKFNKIKDYCYKHEVSYTDYKRKKEKVKWKKEKVKRKRKYSSTHIKKFLEVYFFYNNFFFVIIVK